jgi:CBS domain-containing protein
MHSLVKDLMTTQVVTVGPSARFKEIVARLAEHRVSALPVVDDDGRVLGLVSEADLLLKEEFPDPDQDIPLFWTKRRRLEREKAAASTARNLMTVAVASISPEATVPEAARRMHTAGVKRLPVVDQGGRLVGIISRADLLKVFLRADADLATDVRQQVLRRTMAIDPDKVAVEVRDGVVTVGGRLERSSLIPILVGLVRGLDGVVDVVDQLTFETDDTPFMVPSNLLIDRAPGVRRRI